MTSREGRERPKTTRISTRKSTRKAKRATRPKKLRKNKSDIGDFVQRSTSIPRNTSNGSIIIIKIQNDNMFDEMDSDDISSILAEHYSSPVTSTDMTKFDFKVSNTKKKKKKKTRFQAATPSIDKYQPSTLSLKRIRKQRSHSVGNDDDCNANKIKIKESDTGIYDDDGKEGYSSSNSSKKRSKKKKKTNDVNDQFTDMNLQELRLELLALHDETMIKVNNILSMEADAISKRKIAAELQKTIDEELLYIHERRALIENELKDARPAIERAKRALSNIKKRDLDEIRALKKPPKVIEAVMKSVAIMLANQIEIQEQNKLSIKQSVSNKGNSNRNRMRSASTVVKKKIIKKDKKLEWRDVQKIMNNSFFIKTCIEFDTRNLLPKCKQELIDNYVNEKDYNYERVMKASKVCGPLVLWVQSHVKYSALLLRVKPMEDEVQLLSKNLVRDKIKAKALLDIVQELEKNTSKYKFECEEMVRIIVRSHSKQLSSFTSKLEGMDEDLNRVMQQSEDL